MKIGFIGLGRMGGGIAGRILEAGHDLLVYARKPEQAKPLNDAGATFAATIPEVCKDRELVITMLPSDEALDEVAGPDGGISASLPAGVVHMAMGTHGIAVVRKLEEVHRNLGHIFIVAPVLGRPDLAAAGKLGIVPAGPPEILNNLAPLFDVLGERIFPAGANLETATALKIAHNFVLGCAIEAMGEADSLVRKYGVDPSLLFDVLTNGLFDSPAYRVYGRIIADRDFDKVGATARIGLKDMNLALVAAELAGMPLPSANVMRDRLLSAIAHGGGAKDWSIVAREQARAGGME